MDIFLGISAGVAFGLLPVYPVHAALIMAVIFFSFTVRD
jgi:hypothetical protein